VKRQYSGTLGKIGNCQITLSVHAVGERGTLPLGWRLYLPEEWCDDLPRRQKAKIPDEVCFRTKPQLAGAMADLIGPVVELHHSTLHCKPPETGHPFPMHQDWAFYKHTDDRFVDVLVHLDDTCHENGEIRFLSGSQKLGALEHITKDEAGKGCTPHLSGDVYRIEDTVPVPARRGDIVCFNIHTIHGSYINTTNQMRRLVRLGYRAPDNVQLEGQSKNRAGWIVYGQRPRTDGQAPFPTQ